MGTFYLHSGEFTTLSFFNKSASFAKKFSRRELEHISSGLVSLYHDSRRGIVDFEIALEQFVLEKI